MKHPHPTIPPKKKTTWATRGAPGCPKCRFKGCKTCFEGGFDRSKKYREPYRKHTTEEAPQLIQSSPRKRKANPRYSHDGEAEQKVQRKRVTNKKQKTLHGAEQTEMDAAKALLSFCFAEKRIASNQKPSNLQKKGPVLPSVGKCSD